MPIRHTVSQLVSSDELTTDELDVSERFDRHPVPPPLLVHQGCARAHEPAGHAGVVVEVIAALEAKRNSLLGESALFDDGPGGYVV